MASLSTKRLFLNLLVAFRDTGKLNVYAKAANDQGDEQTICIFSGVGICVCVWGGGFVLASACLLACFPAEGASDSFSFPSFGQYPGHGDHCPLVASGGSISYLLSKTGISAESQFDLEGCEAHREAHLQQCLLTGSFELGEG